MAHTLASNEAIVGHMAFKIKSLPSLGYELSLGTSLSKISRDGCKVLYVRMKSEQFEILCFDYFILLFYQQPRQTTINAKKANRNKMTFLSDVIK